jgi:hypothetical protein
MNDHPRYIDWSTAIVRYTISGRARGSAIYLSIDDSALELIWQRFLAGGPATRKEVIEDFLDAVSEQGGLGDGTRIRPSRFLGSFEDGLPRCAGFLGAMVLAAHRMSDPTANLEYFRHLAELFRIRPARVQNPEWREQLGLPKEGDDYPDEELWREWNWWIAARGFATTATTGRGGWRCIRYPVSQAILREMDRHSLTELFRSRWTDLRELDRDGLALELSGIAEAAPSFLRSRLESEASDPRLFDAVADAAFAVHQTVTDHRTETSAGDSLRIQAGLYRTEAYTGEVRYWIYPRTPRHWQECPLEVRHADGSTELLRPHRAGWYQPLQRPVGSLARQLWQLSGAKGIVETLELPRRDFWILVSDPDVEYSSEVASWGSPEPGVPFNLLADRSHQPLLNLLCRMGLAEFSAPSQLEIGGERWLEYGDFRIQGGEWVGVVCPPISRRLLAALTPRAARVTISLSGGLSIPNENVWLYGQPPQVTVRGLGDDAVWRVTRGRSVTANPAVVRVNQPLNFPGDIMTGDYFIEVWPRPAPPVTAAEVVENDEPVATRAFRIAAWSALTPTTPHEPMSTRGATFELIGGWLSASEAK